MTPKGGRGQSSNGRRVHRPASPGEWRPWKESMSATCCPRFRSRPWSCTDRARAIADRIEPLTSQRLNTGGACETDRIQEGDQSPCVTPTTAAPTGIARDPPASCTTAPSSPPGAAVSRRQPLRAGRHALPRIRAPTCPIADPAHGTRQDLHGPEQRTRASSGSPRHPVTRHRRRIGPTRSLPNHAQRKRRLACGR
jgi:hypothetical protein